MKIQVDLNEQLWNDFKSKVQGEGKTLREVVPTLFEPALRAYLEPSKPEERFTPDPEIILKAVPPPMPTVKRCELCDMPVDRLFHSEGRRVCYSCWKGELTKDREVSNTSPSEGPSPSSVSSPS